MTGSPDARPAGALHRPYDDVHSVSIIKAPLAPAILHVIVMRSPALRLVGAGAASSSDNRFSPSTSIHTIGLPGSSSPTVLTRPLNVAPSRYLSNSSTLG